MKSDGFPGNIRQAPRSGVYAKTQFHQPVNGASIQSRPLWNQSPTLGLHLDSYRKAAQKFLRQG